MFHSPLVHGSADLLQVAGDLPARRRAVVLEPRRPADRHAGVVAPDVRVADLLGERRAAWHPRPRGSCRSSTRAPDRRSPSAASRRFTIASARSRACGRELPARRTAGPSRSPSVAVRRGDAALPARQQFGGAGEPAAEREVLVHERLGQHRRAPLQPRASAGTPASRRAACPRSGRRAHGRTRAAATLTESGARMARRPK